MQVSDSDHCERTMLFTVSILAKVQINEEDLLRNVESWKGQSLADTSDLVLGRLFCCCCCVTASRNPVFIRNHVACSSSQQGWAEHWRTGRTNFCPSSMSCQSCQLMGRSCSNPVRSPVLKKGHTCRCQPVTSFHYCKGSDQWSVSPSQCWKLRKLEFGRHLKPCVKKILGCWCCCLTASRNPCVTTGITLPVPVQGKNEQSIEQLLLSWKNKHSP